MVVAGRMRVGPARRTTCWSVLALLTAGLELGCGDGGGPAKPDATAGSDGAGHAGAAGSGGGAAGGSGIIELQGLRKAAAEAGKFIGAAVKTEPLRDDSVYREVLSREFDYVTPEDATKWGPLAPTASSYIWKDADAIVEFAEAHSQAVKGHTLIWHRQTPSWVNDSMTAGALRDAMKHHIEATLTRYKGRMRAWDVVNEAVDMATDSGFTESVFYEKLGPSYIADAFRWAREADPDVLLFYNEFGIERTGAKSEFTYELMRALLADGVPIDGIGFQSHLSTHRYPAESDLRENMRRFGELGLRVNISELDVRTRLMPGERAARWDAQRLAFQQVVGACVLEPACEGVTLWGLTDRYSWINTGAEPDEPLIYDTDYRAKPAYGGVLAGLSGSVPVHAENVIEDGRFAAGGEAWSTDGELRIGDAEDREGQAACVRGRADESSGLSQQLLGPLSDGGAFAFSAWARVHGTDTAPVLAGLFVEEGENPPWELSAAFVSAADTGWTELAGYLSLGFVGAPTNIELRVYGPPADVEVCIADVELTPVFAEAI